MAGGQYDVIIIGGGIIGLATAMKMARAVPRHAVPVSLSLVAFVGVGLMRLPLLAVIVFVAPIGIVLAWREDW